MRTIVALLAIATPIATVLAPHAARASAAVVGNARPFVSPAGVQEVCVMVARMPGAVYRAAETREEEALCAIDLHGANHALCPKLFSTSPGTLIHDLRGGAYAGEPGRFERDVCPRGQTIAREAADAPVSFKMSVNTRESSATFANAALLYFHYARYLDAAVHVPPAVLRTVDRNAHRVRVTEPGEHASAGRPALRMNHAGWSALLQAERQPDSYAAPDQLFTADRAAVYGVLLHPRGRQYGAEVNGSRRSGWGEGQNRDFQQTAPFIALRSAQPLPAAIDEGLRQGHAAAAIPSTVAREQMVFWMRELIDIVLLDFIFGQQDRVGNIDYLPYWYWVEDGRVRRAPALGTHAPQDIAHLAPRLLKRTELGDNDAAVRLSYANFARRTGMLDGLRHFNAQTYARVQALARDFDTQGPLWTYTRASFGLSEAEFRRVAANVSEAATLLRTQCEAGRLRFDLEPEAFLRDGAVAEGKPDCAPR